MEYNKVIKVENRVIGEDRTFIIAEIGSNHNQDIKIAYELIDRAVDAGADAIKLQSIKINDLYDIKTLSNENISLLKQIELQEEWYSKIASYAKAKNIIFFSAPTYIDSIKLLINSGCSILKIASPQTIGFSEIVREIGNTNLPAIMSTGYCNYSEIERAVEIFQQTGNKNLILLHCTSQYPTEYCNVNLSFMKTLKKMFGTIVGFSDHTLGIETSLAAVALGAKVIEKHITLSRDMKGPDHNFAIEPDEFSKMVSSIRNIEKSLGDYNKQNLTDFEISFKKELDMKIYANCKIPKGEKLSRSNIKYLRNKYNKGISVWELEKILGRKLKKDIIENELISFDVLED